MKQLRDQMVALGATAEELAAFDQLVALGALSEASILAAQVQSRNAPPTPTPTPTPTATAAPSRLIPPTPEQVAEVPEEVRSRIVAGFRRLAGTSPAAGEEIPSTGDPALDAFIDTQTERGFMVDETSDGRYVVMDSAGNVVGIYEQTPSGAFVLSTNQSFGGGGGGGAASRAALQFETGRDGTIFSIDPNTGTVSRVGVFPELAELPNVEITTDDRGNLISINKDTGEIKILQAGYTFPTSDPDIEIVTNERTGERVAVNSRTGETRVLGTFGFAEIDPERDFALKQASESRLREEMQRTRGLAETNAIAEILRNPADYVSRVFLQRGVESPLTQLTGADIISSLRNAISGASQGTVSPSGEISGAPGGAPASRLNQEAYQQAVQTAQQEALAQAAAVAPDYAQQQANANARAASRLTGAAAVETPQAQLAGNVVQASRLPSQADLVAKAAEVDAAQRAGEIDPGTALRMYNEFASTPIITEVPVEMPVQESFMVPAAPVAPAPANPLANIQSQQEIVDVAKQYAPPAVTALLAGTTEELSPLRMPDGINVATPRQTSRLTGDELAALPTRLAAENVSIGDYADAQKQLFGQTRTNRRGRLLV